MYIYIPTNTHDMHTQTRTLLTYLVKMVPMCVFPKSSMFACASAYSTAVNAWHSEFLNSCSVPKSLVSNVTSLQCSVYIFNTVQVTVHLGPLPSPKDCPGRCVCLASHTDDKETTFDSAAPSSAWRPSSQTKSCWCPCVVFPPTEVKQAVMA